MTKKNQNKEPDLMAGEEAQVDTPETEAEAKEPKAPRVTVKDATDNAREPNPESKKGKVFFAGRDGNTGSVAELAKELGCTTSNIRQHIAQCNTKLGFGYTIEGDSFTIDGDATVSWEEQAAEKAAADEVKKAAAAEKAAAKKAAQAEAGGDDGAEATDEPEGEESEAGDDFLE